MKGVKVHILADRISTEYTCLLTEFQQQATSQSVSIKAQCLVHAKIVEKSIQLNK